MTDPKETLRRYQEAQAKREKAKQEAHTTPLPTVDYKEMLKKYQATHSKPINKAASIKNTIIKWTIIILIAACVFYFVYPKYSFRFPTGYKHLLYKANKITGTVEVYYRDKGQWTAR